MGIFRSRFDGIFQVLLFSNHQDPAAPVAVATNFVLRLRVIVPEGHPKFKKALLSCPLCNTFLCTNGVSHVERAQSNQLPTPHTYPSFLPHDRHLACRRLGGGCRWILPMTKGGGAWPCRRPTCVCSSRGSCGKPGALPAASSLYRPHGRPPTSYSLEKTPWLMQGTSTIFRRTRDPLPPAGELLCLP